MRTIVRSGMFCVLMVLHGISTAVLVLALFMSLIGTDASVPIIGQVVAPFLSPSIMIFPLALVVMGLSSILGQSPLLEDRGRVNA